MKIRLSVYEYKTKFKKERSDKRRGKVKEIENKEIIIKRKKKDKVVNKTEWQTW